LKNFALRFAAKIDQKHQKNRGKQTNISHQFGIARVQKMPSHLFVGLTHASQHCVMPSAFFSTRPWAGSQFGTTAGQPNNEQSSGQS
jgi:hypothetical protein